MKPDLITNTCKFCEGRGFIPLFTTTTLPDGTKKPNPVIIKECNACNTPPAK